MRPWIVRLLVLSVLLGAAGGGFLFWAGDRASAPGPSPTATTVVVLHGNGNQAIAAQLSEAGVIDGPRLFLLELKLAGHPGLQAGEYAFPARISIDGVIDMMRKGQVVVHKLTVAEGLTVAQVLAELRQTEGLAGHPSNTPSEGSLLPQTYFYSLGDSRDSLINRMAKGMTETLDELWPAREPGLPIAGKAEALILASVVERETGIAAERPHVAAVFLNRLQSHMPLQSDPTVIYALSNGEGVLDRPLGHDDLAVNSPYNTYLSNGLPPGPICNPGRASIQAVLHPMGSDDLYFVADGSGGHVFAKTLEEHNRNVAKWRTAQKAKSAK